MPIVAYKDIYPVIAASAFVDNTASVIGEVNLAADVSVWPQAVIRGDVNAIMLGECTNVQEGSVLHVSPDCEFYPGGCSLIIGHHVTIGHKVVLHGCVIRNYCLLGMGSIVLDGAVIEDEVIIGAGSLVPPNRTLQSGYLYLGSPVRQIRPITAQEKKLLHYSADIYVQLKNDYIGSSSS